MNEPQSYVDNDQKYYRYVDEIANKVIAPYLAWARSGFWTGFFRAWCEPNSDYIILPMSQVFNAQSMHYNNMVKGRTTDEIVARLNYTQKLVEAVSKIQDETQALRNRTVMEGILSFSAAFALWGMAVLLLLLYGLDWSAYILIAVAAVGYFQGRRWAGQRESGAYWGLSRQTSPMEHYPWMFDDYYSTPEAKAGGYA